MSQCFVYWKFIIIGNKSLLEVWLSRVERRGFFLIAPQNLKKKLPVLVVALSEKYDQIINHLVQILENSSKSPEFRKIPDFFGSVGALHLCGKIMKNWQYFFGSMIKFSWAQRKKNFNWAAQRIF